MNVFGSQAANGIRIRRSKSPLLVTLTDKVRLVKALSLSHDLTSF